MIASGFPTDSLEIINSVTYLVDAECPAPTWSASSDASVYDIDGTGSALANFTVEMSNAGIYSWNFGDGFLESSAGDISHVYTSPGIYNVVVTGCMTNCLPLNSCSMQTFMIEVRDTTSSVLPDATDSGIRIYPNPSFANITLDIPDADGVLEFQLFDVHGAERLSGSAGPGLTDVDLTHLSSGLYTLRLRDPITGIAFKSERVLFLRSTD
jgi:hypothetical protein